MHKDCAMDVADIVKGTISHKKIVYFIVAAICALGIFGLVRMNKDEFPTFEIKNGLIVGIYPGADAKEVEDQLTKPLEDILFSFSEVSRDNTSSFSRNGICYIYTDLTTPASTKNEVWAKIKLKLEASRMTLPAGVLAVAVMDDFSSVSTLLIALESDDKGYGELQGYADELSYRLREIPQTANVRIIGEQKEEVAVTLDMAKLSAYGISPSSVMLACRAAGVQPVSGSFSTGYASSQIRVSNTVASEREIAEKIIYSDPQGNILRLKDIARIERRALKPSSLIGYNGNSAVILSVEMRAGECGAEQDNGPASGREGVCAVIHKGPGHLDACGDLRDADALPDEVCSDRKFRASCLYGSDARSDVHDRDRPQYSVSGGPDRCARNDSR